MTDFHAGFVSRHDAAAAALSAAFAVPNGFEPRDLTGKPPASGSGPKPKSFSPQSDGGPRHFTPFDPDTRQNEGWDPSAPDAASFGDGFVDVASVRMAAHAEGFAAGLAQGAADAGRDRAFVESLGTAIGQGAAFDRERLARQLRQTVLLLVSRLVGDVGVSGELLASRIESAVDALADSAESALLRLNPADVTLVDGRLPATLFPVGDPNVVRGSFVLESASTIVEDGPDRWLEQLTTAIDRVAPPTC
ncbi:FliH/SctL family protein [uncultured Sphingomonas sp.]|uniref:FliH/SctL family protein n=1 Tax=uncultured Sphingomonas sp. TaxID=158754 RepID=UPI0025D1E626|nr:FliH/SctL family protein [uncultured Sphingomonas sp.]